MLPRLLVIADDLTGALDTGVQFCKQGITTQVHFAGRLDWRRLPPELQVLIVNAESRHLPAAEAYQIVHSLATNAYAHGVRVVYKKIDSGLRGNIGAELHALANAAGEAVYLLPAFPKMRRVTRLGTHYIDEVPVSESVFGKDPFEPVRFSSIPELIALQSEVPVSLSRPQSPENPPGKAIVVVDSETDGDLQLAAHALKSRQPRALAGCAGFAAFLPVLIDFDTRPSLPPKGAQKMIVISGSINPITLQQGQYAKDNGFTVFELTPAQKLESGYFSGESAKEFFNQVRQAALNAPVLVTAAMTTAAVESTDGLISGQQLTKEDARVTISKNIGEFAAKLLLEEDAVLFIVGGDTLYATLTCLGIYEVEPLQELVPGVVLSRIDFKGRSVEFVTKSGGFGSEDTILQAGNILRSITTNAPNAQPQQAAATPDS